MNSFVALGLECAFSEAFEETTEVGEVGFLVVDRKGPTSASARKKAASRMMEAPFNTIHNDDDLDSYSTGRTQK